MQPSSLIFVLVIAIWAAYLLQHWLRRREHLSTARTLDRFSESMRVLDRTKIGRTSASGGMSTTGSIPLHRRRTPGLAIREVAGGNTMAVVVPGGSESASAAVSQGSSVAVEAGAGRGAVQPAPAARARASAGSSGGNRAIFGGVLLGSVVVALVTMVLAALTSLSWVVPGLAVLVALGSLIGLRRVAAQATAARVATRTTARPGRASADRPAPRRTAANPARRTSRSAASAGRPAKATTGASPTRRSGQPARSGEPAAYTSATATTVLPQRAARDEVFDVNTFDTPAARPVAGGDGWSPTPVPPPTYTLKAKAVYAAAEEVEDEVTSPYADVSDLAERRRLASGQ